MDEKQVSTQKSKKTTKHRELTAQELRLYAILAESGGVEMAEKYYGFPTLTKKRWIKIISCLTTPFQWGQCTAKQTWTGGRNTKRGGASYACYMQKEQNAYKCYVIAPWLFRICFPTPPRMIGSLRINPGLARLCGHSMCFSPTCLIEKGISGSGSNGMNLDITHRNVSKSELRAVSDWIAGHKYTTPAESRACVTLTKPEIRAILMQFSQEVVVNCDCVRNPKAVESNQIISCTGNSWMGEWRIVPLVKFRGQYVELMPLFKSILRYPSLDISRKSNRNCPYPTCASPSCYSLDFFKEEKGPLDPDVKTYVHSCGYPKPGPRTGRSEVKEAQPNKHVDHLLALLVDKTTPYASQILDAIRCLYHPVPEKLDLTQCDIKSTYLRQFTGQNAQEYKERRELLRDSKIAPDLYLVKLPTNPETQLTESSRYTVYRLFIPGGVPASHDLTNFCGSEHCLSIPCLFARPFRLDVLEQPPPNDSYVASLRAWLHSKQWFNSDLHSETLLKRFAFAVGNQWTFGSCTRGCYFGPTQGRALIDMDLSRQHDVWRKTAKDRKFYPDKHTSMAYAHEWLRGELRLTSNWKDSPIWQLKAPKCGYWNCVNCDFE